MCNVYYVHFVFRGLKILIFKKMEKAETCLGVFLKPMHVHGCTNIQYIWVPPQKKKREQALENVLEAARQASDPQVN